MNSMLSTPINLLENAKNSKLCYENVNMFTLHCDLQKIIALCNLNIALKFGLFILL